jgi:hypothetical protein
LSAKSFASPSQFGLLLLCAAWLLPGLIGHAPWKGGDGDHFVQLWLLLQQGLPPQAEPATPPLYYWVAMATAWLTSPLLALADGARLASGVFVALALYFVARTARALYGAEAGWAAALTLLGCVGLLVRGHELNAYTAEFAAAAIMLYAIARLPSGAASGWTLAAGAILMLLAGGAAEALLFLALAAPLPLLLEDYRGPVVRRRLMLGIGVAVTFAAAWLAFLAAQRIPLAQAFNLQRWLGADGLAPTYFPSILGWYAWPAWPLALWGVYRGRRQWRSAGIGVPVVALVGLLALYAFAAHPAEEQGLILLLPLALLGAAGLFTLQRGAANALLWFAVMLFGFIGLLFWAYWAAHDLGVPERLARRLVRFGVEGVGELRLWTLVLGAAVTLAWLVFLARVSRSPLRPILVWSAGITFIWVLLMALFQSPLDRRMSYLAVAEGVAARVPTSACIATADMRSQQRSLIAYHSGRRLLAGDAECAWLLRETRRKAPAPDVGAEWVKQWEGARPGDRSDRYHLYVRR